MFSLEICFLEPEPVGAELFWVEPDPEPIFSIWSRSRGKMARLRNIVYVKYFFSLYLKPVYV